MAVNITIISASNDAFANQYLSIINSGSRPIGDPWSDGTDTYSVFATYDCQGIKNNPDLISRVFRAKHFSASYGTYSSSVLSTTEYNTFYSSSI